MADPHKPPSGLWRIQWLDATGKRRGETLKTFDAARSALRRRQTQVDDIRAGRVRPRAEQTVNEVADEWLGNREPDANAPPAVRDRLMQPRCAAGAAAAAQEGADEALEHEGGAS